MNTLDFENIGRVWREQGSGDIRRTRVESLSTSLGRASRITAAIRQRMRVAGWVVAIPLLILFSFWAVSAPTPLAAIGAGIMSLWALLVVLQYRAISRTHYDPTISVRLAIESEVQQLRALESFGRNAKWFRAGGALGWFLYVLGRVIELDDMRTGIASLAIVVLVVGGFELWIRMARKRGPSRTALLREDLESWIVSLEAVERDEAMGGPGTATPLVAGHLDAAEYRRGVSLRDIARGVVLRFLPASVASLFAVELGSATIGSGQLVHMMQMLLSWGAFVALGFGLGLLALGRWLYPDAKVTGLPSVLAGAACPLVPLGFLILNQRLETGLGLGSSEWRALLVLAGVLTALVMFFPWLSATPPHMREGYRIGHDETPKKRSGGDSL